MVIADIRGSTEETRVAGDEPHVAASAGGDGAEGVGGAHGNEVGARVPNAGVTEQRTTPFDVVAGKRFAGAPKGDARVGSR